jgi:hypothetical protein
MRFELVLVTWVREVGGNEHVRGYGVVCGCRIEYASIVIEDEEKAVQHL